MTRYIIRKFAEAIVTLLGLSLVVFSAVHMTGDPARMLLPVRIDASEEVYEQLKEELGLNRPFMVQYLDFMAKLITKGDFGRSVRSQKEARHLLLERIPATIQLAAAGLFLSFVIGVPAGILSAVKRDTLADKVGKAVAIFGLAAPQFWVAIMAVILFGAYLQWLPVYGAGGVKNLILPAAVLALGPLAAMMRLGRSSMLDILDSEFIKFARVKGMRESIVIWKHGARNAVIPLMTFAGLTLAGLMNGSIVVEQVFAWPGLGRMMIEGVIQRDMPLVQATVLVSGFFYVSSALIIDVLYGFADPRIRDTN
jgi:peptide/nickel transport system permease protein